jgi:membrane-bound metal-dependent hydrolase YbcI (DUF457 family)
MPSPIGHALAGVAIAWTTGLADGRRSASDRLVPVCMALAAAPDLDLLIPGTHRTATHSVTALVLVTILAAAVTGRVTRGTAGLDDSRRSTLTRWRVALVCGLAYASHLLLDWLGADRFPPRGIQLLWPFSDRWFISDLDVFRQTARQHFLTPPIIRQNLAAVAQELAILLPILVVIGWVRIRQQRN